jgi:hypothetical protein
VRHVARRSIESTDGLTRLNPLHLPPEDRPAGIDQPPRQVTLYLSKCRPCRLSGMQVGQSLGNSRSCARELIAAVRRSTLVAVGNGDRPGRCEAGTASGRFVP